MQDSRNTQRPSRSSRLTSRNVSVGGPLPSLQRGLYHQCTPSSRHMSVQASTPGPKRNQYSNKEFARVNSGFECIGEFLNAAYKEGTGTLAVDVDFSQSVVPPLQLARPLITEALVHRLLHPPRYAFLHRTLSLHWIIDAVGYKNIVFSKADERFVLVQGSEPRKRGKELGVPAVYMEWLRGDDATVSACDLVMCLTPELFVE